jgi:hypothetical protein
VLTAHEINRRFPAFRLPNDHSGLFQPNGGFVASERAIVAHAELAKAAGAEIHTGETVLGWEPIAGGGMRVTTDRGAYEAGRLILSAGAWLGDLVPSLAPVAVAERQVLGWFEPGNPAHYMPDTMPVTILMVDEGPISLPIWGGPGVKVGLHHHRYERGHADDLMGEPTAEDEALLRVCLARYMPDAQRAACPGMASLPLHQHAGRAFHLDSLPGNEDVIVASPCSGHGYKFASVIGEILADLATTGAAGSTCRCSNSGVSPAEVVPGLLYRMRKRGKVTARFLGTPAHVPNLMSPAPFPRKPARHPVGVRLQSPVPHQRRLPEGGERGTAADADPLPARTSGDADAALSGDCNRSAPAHRAAR